MAIAFATLPHVCGPIEREILEGTVAGHDRRGTDTVLAMATREEAGVRLVFVQRCLYCDAVVRVEIGRAHV